MQHAAHAGLVHAKRARQLSSAERIEKRRIVARRIQHDPWLALAQLAKPVEEPSGFQSRRTTQDGRRVTRPPREGEKAVTGHVDRYVLLAQGARRCERAVIIRVGLEHRWARTRRGWRMG